MRTITVKLEVNLTIKADSDIEISKIIDELDYNFSDTTTKANIEDMSIEDFEIIDSR
jgi:hypothetical protein